MKFTQKRRNSQLSDSYCVNFYLSAIAVVLNKMFVFSICILRPAFTLSLLSSLIISVSAKFSLNYIIYKSQIWMIVMKLECSVLKGCNSLLYVCIETKQMTQIIQDQVRHICTLLQMLKVSSSFLDAGLYLFHHICSYLSLFSICSSMFKIFLSMLAFTSTLQVYEDCLQTHCFLDILTGKNIVM